MNKLHLTDDQLSLVQSALDFYSRIGIGQFEQIKEHPTFEEFLYKVCQPKREPVVGDRTPQGEILEIKNGKALINGSVDKKTGRWCKKRAWKKLKDVNLSTDYGKLHDIRKIVDASLIYPRNMLLQDMEMPQHASWGIYHEDAHDTCRMAFDIIQVIRHN
jgi:hypothetical protein